MQQFFIESIEDARLSSDQRNQCLKVLRMRKGDQVRLVDAQSKAGIYAFADDELNTLEFIEDIIFDLPKVKITLIASLIRNERLEWMIQKACEVGVDRIVLYSAQNGVVKDFGKRSDRKIERLNMIAKEASEQSFRHKAVEVGPVITMNEIPQYTSELNLYADVKPLEHIHSVMKDEDSISIIIGPEGGYSDKERDFFESESFKPVSIGKHVLRAETASMVACVLIHAKEVQV